MHSGLERPIKCLKRIEKNYEYLIQKNDKPLIGSKAATWVIIGASSQSTLKYVWHFCKASHKPGHLGSPASAIHGCCLGNEWASFIQLSLSALRRPLSMAECCLQGDDSPSLQPSGRQWKLGFLAEMVEYSRPAVQHLEHTQGSALRLPSPGATPGLVGECSMWISLTLDPTYRAQSLLRAWVQKSADMWVQRRENQPRCLLRQLRIPRCECKIQTNLVKQPTKIAWLGNAFLEGNLAILIKSLRYVPCLLLSAVTPRNLFLGTSWCVLKDLCSRISF